MNLVTFNGYCVEKEVLVNCDNITYVEPTVLEKDKTAIYFTGEQLLIVDEDYEEVKKRLDHAR